MKVKTAEGVREYRTVWMEENVVNLIDQRKLPHSFGICQSPDYRETVSAIRDMVVRGAPAIGAAAAYAMAQAASEYRSRDVSGFMKHMAHAAETIKSARPTAYDLFDAVDFVGESISRAVSVDEARGAAVKSSHSYADKSAENCRLIGVKGAKLIKDGCKVLTHCNAGALACVDYGTALSPVRFAHYAEKKIHVFVDETRPRFQGSKLTAWELLQEGIPFSVIVDNAAGYFMRKGDVDVVIIGADRITRNGDVVNKIGTYEKAVVAKENGVPFYVAVPETSFDRNVMRGDEVVIEERSGEEVLFADGVRVAPLGSIARNPSFDVTPKGYVSGYITEKGIKKF